MATCSTYLCIPAACDCTMCADRQCCTAEHRHGIIRFFSHARSMFAATLGIEILS